MNDADQYLFDLQGYLVLEKIVSDSILKACNVVLDRFEQLPESDFPSPLCLGEKRSLQGLYISNILEADPAMQDLMDLPVVLDAVQTVTGGPYRLNHTYTIYRWGGRVHRSAHARNTDYSQSPIPLSS